MCLDLGYNHIAAIKVAYKPPLRLDKTLSRLNNEYMHAIIIAVFKFSTSGLDIFINQSLHLRTDRAAIKVKYRTSFKLGY